MSDQIPDQIPMSDQIPEVMSEKTALEVLKEIEIARFVIARRIQSDRELLRPSDPAPPRLRPAPKIPDPLDEVTRIVDLAARIVALFGGLAYLAHMLDKPKPSEKR